MENDNASLKSGRPSYWRFGLVGCAALTTFTLLLIGIVLLSVWHSPYYRNLMECKTRMKVVGAALDRYAAVNDKYPKKLEDLIPDYLSATEFHCPIDQSPATHISYKYTWQAMDAPPDAVLLECDRHKLRQSMPSAKQYLLKSGDVILVTPSGDVRRVD